jgi:DNA-binding MarR family transcriptional regulator
MPELENELQILQEIERNPDLTQASLAVQMGVAVGSVNWYLKRLVGKGYVKVTHLQRRKLRYFLTPSGLALKVNLTRSYMDVSLRVYRELRDAAQQALVQVRQAGYNAITIDGQDEAVEILRLTCLEQGVQVERGGAGLPLVRGDSVDFTIAWPDSKNHEGGEPT